MKTKQVKTNLLLILFIILFHTSNAQIVIGINSLSANLQLEQDTLFDFKIYNISSTDTVKFWWKLVKCVSFPYDNWETQVADQLHHYVANFDSSPMNKPNTILPNDSTFFQINFTANEFEGSCSLCLKLFSDKNFVNEIASTNCNDLITVGTSLSNFAKHFSPIIYPNPSNNYFVIKNDDEVTSVKVYDAMGRKIIDEKHYLGKSYDLSKREKGFYKIVLTTWSKLLLTNTLQHF